MTEKSLFERLGGKEAVNAAVDIFYDKVFADPELIPFFDNTDQDAQRRKQKAFMTYAFGGMTTYSGRNMADAHAEARAKGLNESHFNLVSGHLVSTLKDLQVPKELIDEVVATVLTTKDAVLHGKA